MSTIDHHRAQRLAQTTASHLGAAVTELRALRDLLHQYDEDNSQAHIVPNEVMLAYLNHAGVTGNNGDYGGVLADMIRAVEDVHTVLRRIHHDQAGFDASRQELTVRHRLELVYGGALDLS